MHMSISQLKLRRNWDCSSVKMIFWKPLISGNIIKECSSTAVVLESFVVLAVSFLYQLNEENESIKNFFKVYDI